MGFIVAFKKRGAHLVKVRRSLVLCMGVVAVWLCALGNSSFLEAEQSRSFRHDMFQLNLIQTDTEPACAFKSIWTRSFALEGAHLRNLVAVTSSVLQTVRTVAAN